MNSKSTKSTNKKLNAKKLNIKKGLSQRYWASMIFVSFILLSIFVLIAIPFLQILKNQISHNEISKKQISNNSNLKQSIQNNWKSVSNFEELTKIIKSKKSFDGLMSNENISKQGNLYSDNPYKQGAKYYSETNNQFNGIDEPDILKINYPYAYYVYNLESYIYMNKPFIDKDIMYENGSKIVILDLRDNSIVKTISIKGNVQSLLKGDGQIFVIGSGSYDLTSDCYVGINKPSQHQFDGDGIIDLREDFDYHNGSNQPPEKCIRYIPTTHITTINLDNTLGKTQVLEGSFSDARFVNGKILMILNNSDLLYNRGVGKIKLYSGEESSLSARDVNLVYNKNIDYFGNVKSLYLLESKDLRLIKNVNILSGYDSIIYVDGKNIIYADSSGENTNITLFDNNLKIVTDKIIDGKILNSYSIGTNNGSLFIATTDNLRFFKNNMDRKINYIFSFDNKLNELDKIEYSKGKMIYSARFIGNRVYISTFFQTDPLIIFDISDPKNIKQKGELNIKGFYSHLQNLPGNENVLVGIGNDFENGMSMGLKISLFDISNDNNPIELDKISFNEEGLYSYSEGLYNPRSIMVYDNIIGIPIITEDGKGYVLYSIDNNKLNSISKFKGYINRATYKSGDNAKVYLWTNNKVVVSTQKAIQLKNQYHLILEVITLT